MGRVETFDAFYVSTRESVVHQTFALTGDLAATQSAVKDAYVAAWHHWRKVSALDDPLAWVRPVAWRLAQRRHAARLWHRRGDIPDADRAVLDALAALGGTARRLVLLTEMTGLVLLDAAREVGVTLSEAETQHRAAQATLAERLGTSVLVADRLEALRVTARAVRLPRPSVIRRAGQKRRQTHTALAAAAATVLALAAGSFVHTAAEPSAPGASPTPENSPAEAGPSLEHSELPEAQPAVLSAGHLLDEDQVRRLAPAQSWRSGRPHDNTEGDGINTICQRARFADPDGVATLVRSHRAPGPQPRTAIQTVEVSANVRAARATYATTLQWYAGCRVGRLQILGSHHVEGIGDEGRLLQLRVWRRPVTTYAVGVARIGNIVTSTVAGTAGGPAPAPRHLAQSLADAVSMLCPLSSATECPREGRVTPAPPPPSGEARGMLAVADLPPAGDIGRPWVGTDATRARVNPAATTCDNADFFASGAEQARTRTFLIPEARLPTRFGVSETYGVFAGPGAARRFVERMRDRVNGCEDRELATTVSGARSRELAGRGGRLVAWDVATEISDTETIRFRLGFVQRGRTVAQVTFAPSSTSDMTPQQFDALLVRAVERLGELG